MFIIYSRPYTRINRTRVWLNWNHVRVHPWLQWLRRDCNLMMTGFGAVPRVRSSPTGLEQSHGFGAVPRVRNSPSPTIQYWNFVLSNLEIKSEFSRVHAISLSRLDSTTSPKVAEPDLYNSKDCSGAFFWHPTFICHGRKDNFTVTVRNIILRKQLYHKYNCY